MGADGQLGLKRFARSGVSFLRSSIVWKLTLFVGVLVALNGGVLIGVAYFTTSAILRDQIHERLSTVAADRQEMLDGRAAPAGASVLPVRRAAAPPPAPCAARRPGRSARTDSGAETEPILARVRSNTTGFLALWIEDEAGQVIASSGPEDLVAVYCERERPGHEARWRAGRSAAASRRDLRAGLLAWSASRDGRILGTRHAALGLRADRGVSDGPARAGETGEVLVGVGNGETIRLILPPRLRPSMTEVAASELPALSAAIAGQFGFDADDRLSRPRRAGGLPAGGVGYPGWGLIAKIDSAEAYEPVGRLRWLVAGLGRACPGCWGWGRPTRSPGGSRGRSAGWPGRRRPSPPAI